MAPGIIAAFIRRYNEEWIIERLDYRTRSSPDRSWRRWPNYGAGLSKKQGAITGRIFRS